MAKKIITHNLESVVKDLIKDYVKVQRRTSLKAGKQFEKEMKSIIEIMKRTDNNRYPPMPARQTHRLEFAGTSDSVALPTIRKNEN